MKLKGGLFKIFNRTTVCILGILIQVAYLTSLFWTLGTYYTYSYVVFQLIGVALSVYIVSRDINPSYKIAWIIAILTFPIFGVMFYVFFGNSHSGDRLRKRMRHYSDFERKNLPQNEELFKKLSKESNCR